jgi:hypothetical protein
MTIGAPFARHLNHNTLVAVDCRDFAEYDSRPHPVFGKSVRFRRCPATVSGDESPSSHCASGKAGSSENPKSGDRPDDLAVCRPRGWWCRESAFSMPDPLSEGSGFVFSAPSIHRRASGRRHTTRDGYVADIPICIYCCRCDCGGDSDASDRSRCFGGLNDRHTITAKAGAINDSIDAG